MASIPVMCMVCGKSVKDSIFPQHMSSVHGGMGQSEAIMAEKNIPPKQAPIILDKEAPPPPEFMEMAKMLDEKPQAPPPVPSRTADSAKPKVEERKPLPITLEYNYTGECPQCFISLKTVIVHANGKCFAVAICMNHGQLREREVADLEEVPMIKKLAKEFVDKEFNPKRKEVKHGKRSKPVVWDNAPISTKMQPSRLSDSNKQSIQS